MSGKKGRSGRRPNATIMTPVWWCGERVKRKLKFLAMVVGPILNPEHFGEIERVLIQVALAEFHSFFPNKGKRRPTEKAISRWLQKHRA